MKKTALIIGAGPAGLTAALELLQRTDIIPIVVEREPVVGGICRTVRKGPFLVDVGGHRFFSKSDRVLNWWFSHLPLRPGDSDLTIHYEGRNKSLEAPRAKAARDEGPYMMVRPRNSRILHNGKFFKYPLSLDLNTILNLGPLRVLTAGASYLKSSLFPVRPEETLEDFLVNRFGRHLFETFFKDYTEKVWGRSCDKISAEWGRQRIKGLSIFKSIRHALEKAAGRRGADVRQRGTETSLIERFLYPPEGPGQLWSIVAEKIERLGGQLLLGWEPAQFHLEDLSIRGVSIRKLEDESIRLVPADYVFSSMPIPELVQLLGPVVPPDVFRAAQSLEFRNFISVAIALEGAPEEISARGPIKDNWIYIQEPEFKAGRIQIMNNWSPDTVKQPGTTLVALEYFCNDSDRLWTSDDYVLRSLAEDELRRLGIFSRINTVESFVIRQRHAYPGYFGGYERFPVVKEWLNGVRDLFPIGRNGQHRYNNQDHSMLTAMRSVDHLLGTASKESIWEINADGDYHEEQRNS